MAKWTRQHSGYWAHWPLAEALSWRMEFGCSLHTAFKELVELMCQDPDRMFGTGVLIGSHPLRPRGWDFPPYEPFATPNRLPFNTPNLGRVPFEDWCDLEPTTDSDGRPTNKARWASAKVDAWDYIELDRHTLMKAWLEYMARSERSCLLLPRTGRRAVGAPTRSSSGSRRR